MPIQKIKIKNYFISQYFLINFSWLIITLPPLFLFYFLSSFLYIYMINFYILIFLINLFNIFFFSLFYKTFQKKTIYLPLNFMIGFTVGCNKQWNHALKSEFNIYILIFLAKAFINISAISFKMVFSFLARIK